MNRKTKISHDPNNTNWSRSTSGFGHKILSSQGWTPGSFLGAQNAAHADTFTAASASHIKVTVKDDTLGLGARPRRNPLDEPTGLDAFKGLLGRLNGKTDIELEAEQRKREDVKLARYAATRWQEVRFISGGLLTQEKMEALSPEVSKQEVPSDPQPDDALDEIRHEEDKDDSDPGASGLQAVNTSTSKSPKIKGSHPKRPDEGGSKSEAKRRKKSKKRKHDSECENPDGETQGEKLENPIKEHKGSSSHKATTKERRPMGRHVFRSRYIEQKKRALLDDKSLNEVTHTFVSLGISQFSANWNRYSWSNRRSSVVIICMHYMPALFLKGTEGPSLKVVATYFI